MKFPRISVSWTYENHFPRSFFVYHLEGRQRSWMKVWISFLVARKASRSESGMIKGALAAVSKKTEVLCPSCRIWSVWSEVCWNSRSFKCPFRDSGSLTMSEVIRESLEWSSVIFPKIHDSYHITSLEISIWLLIISWTFAIWLSKHL